MKTLSDSPSVSPLCSIYPKSTRSNPYKRAFDLFFSASALLIFSPLLLFLYCFIPLLSPGPAIYRCIRIGRGGKPFMMYKFRTMHLHADQKLKQLLQDNPSLKKEWEKNHKLKKDPRLIPGGSFLRKSSLDEFLQFFNVLQGDMSVVGPRPYYREELEERVKGKAVNILSVKPGLTGLWQISGRSHTTFEKRVELDERYVSNPHLFTDIKIIFVTLYHMLFSKGAY